MSVTCLDTPQTRCRGAIARCDITSPIGIYHRMWGAATHDRATGVHKPLLATLLWLEPEAGDASQAFVIVALDHCILDTPDIEQMEQAKIEYRPGDSNVYVADMHNTTVIGPPNLIQPGQN